MVLTSLCLAIGVGCNQRFQEAFQQEAQRRGATEDACGPVDIAIFVPDCPLEGVCFSTACANHGACYSICRADRKTCDDAFLDDLRAICDQGFEKSDPAYVDCRFMGITYWLAVALQGEEAFQATQLDVCGAPPPPETSGACCRAGDPPSCTEVDAEWSCSPSGVFVPGLTCAEVEEQLGGCNAPANDLCQAMTPICGGLTTDPDLGRCTGDAKGEAGGGVCSVASQDCANGGQACLSVEGQVVRCTVATDNRLANTDGPAAAGECEASGADSFRADVWYSFVPPCPGTLVIRMCGRQSYDAMLAVYGGHEAGAACICPTQAESLLACNDDFCSLGVASTAGVTVEGVVAGACYTIRVGGWGIDDDDALRGRGESEIDIGVFCADEEPATPAATGD
ncbi:MAG: hypothetical protein HY763_16140 [Planctomycetes bacterium]|nr:hypothetical protein [Planctomycetota bacterium]